MYRAAEYLRKALLDAGADHAAVYETEGNPVTFAEKMIDPSWPTVLVYGHMDVMPVDPIDLWNSDPFDPRMVDGKIFGRGADDDKGQLFMHVKAFEYLVPTPKAPNSSSHSKAKRKQVPPILAHFVRATGKCSVPTLSWFPTLR